MDISFVIVTGGQRKEKLSLLIKSIQFQIDDPEIIVVGNTNQSPSVICVREVESAKLGLLGDLRNKGCSLASHSNIVILDDDMLLHRDWYNNFISYGKDFDILTSQVRSPDGTRFWDHCCYQSPDRGHCLLGPEEYNDYLYMFGGQAWIMKKKVFDRVQWDGVFYNMKNMLSISDYQLGKHNEDTDFALKCRSSGFKISHNHNMKAFHCDGSYTTIGSIVRKRKKERDYTWVKDQNLNLLPPHKIAQSAGDLFNRGFHAEAVDVCRVGLNMYFSNLFISETYEQILMGCKSGPPQHDDRFNPSGDKEYLETIDFYDGAMVVPEQ